MSRILGSGQSHAVGAPIGAAILACAALFGAIIGGPVWAAPQAGANTTSTRADTANAAAPAARQPGCTKRLGRGFAPTEHFARLKAWETVAQATGNWPFQTDEFRSTNYRCRAERNGRMCFVAIEVCRWG